MSCSKIEASLRGLYDALGAEGGRLAVDMALDSCTPCELAVLFYDWQTWARPKQIIPEGKHRSVLLKCGRAWGKTITVVKNALMRIENDPSIQHVGLLGPTEDQFVALYLTGASGFLKNTPPWLGVEYQKADQRLVFGNGVIASLYSAQAPSRMNGTQHQLMLCTELAYWPESTRQQAFENVRLTTRTGRGQYWIDTTPEDDHPLLDALIATHEAQPTKHLLIEGASDENALNLSEGIVEEWRQAFRGTDTEATALDGIYRNESPNRIFKRASVERALRGGLARYERRIISIDPSTAGKKYSDAIGIVELARDAGQVFVLNNLGGKLDINEWPDMVLDHYRDNRLDLLMIECDHASTAWPKIFGDGCKLRGWQLVTVEGDAPVRHTPGRVNFHAFYVGNKRSKAERARAAASWIDKGRVSLVRGALGTLEKQMYAFTGADNRPDDAVDALTNGIMLLALGVEAPDAMVSTRGLAEVNAAISGAIPRAQSVTHNGLTIKYDGSSSMRDYMGGGYSRGNRI